MIKLGATIRDLISSNDPATGGSVAADSTPTVVVVEQGTAMGYTPTVTSLATGLYEVALVLSGGNGFDDGKEYTAYSVVIVGGVTTRTPLANYSAFTIGTAEADVTKWLGTTVATPSVAGVPTVAATAVGASTESSGAIFHKNEATAAKRRADMIIIKDDGTAAPRGTSFAGNLYVSPSSSLLAAAAGTLTNKRKPLAFADITITAVDTSADNVTAVAHGLETGDGTERLINSGGALPAGLATGTDYYIIKDTVDKVAFATSLAGAYANTRVNITGSGSGTSKITNTGAVSQRGIDGVWTYEATQAETNFDGSELAIIMDGKTGYARAVANVMMNGDSVEGFESIAEGSLTYGDALRVVLGVLAGKVTNFGTGLLVFRNTLDTKTRITVTTDASGRIAILIGDPT